MNKTGDLCIFRDVTGEHKLTGVAGDGVVQYEVNGKTYTTDSSEIQHNYHQASRERAGIAFPVQPSGLDFASYDDDI